MKPRNALARPISDLIETLKKLPPGTTFAYRDGGFGGGEVQCLDLGTCYELNIDIVEGFDPPRPLTDADTAGGV